MDCDDLRIVFIAPVQNQPRHLKRIREMEKLGVDCVFACFTRNYLRAAVGRGSHIALGFMSHGSYFRRLFSLAHGVFALRKSGIGATHFYCFGLDCLFVGLLASVFGRQKLVLELGDIRKAMLKQGLSGRLLRYGERLLVGRSDLLVVTSNEFVEKYFGAFQGLQVDQHAEIENKVASSVVRPKFQQKLNNQESLDPIRIGYFGLLRCRRSFDLLKEVARVSNGRIRVIIHGKFFGLDGAELEVAEAEGVEYHGEFASPDDLEGIYSSVDIVWACYPYGGAEVGNWCWAKTNRFYESGFYTRPMVCSEGTVDGRRVLDLDIGFCVDLSEPTQVIGRVVGLTRGSLDRYAVNLTRLPSSLFQYTDDHERLLTKIRRL